MKKIISLSLIFLLLFSVRSVAQEIITDTIIFTEIYVDMGSPFLTYKENNGDSKSDLLFKGGDVIISGWVIFNYDDGILIEFNAEAANEIIGKKVARVYHVEDNGYFKAPMVHKLSLLEGEISSDGLRVVNAPYNGEAWLCGDEFEANLNFSNDKVTGTFTNKSENKIFQAEGHFMEITGTPFIFIRLKISEYETHTYLGIEELIPDVNEDYDDMYFLKFYKIYSEDSASIKEKLIALRVGKQNSDWEFSTCTD